MTIPALERRAAERRAAERRTLLGRAEAFVAGVPTEVDLRAAVVIGSVARGDFHPGSDVDVIVVADHLADRLLDRYEQLGARPGGWNRIHGRRRSGATGLAGATRWRWRRGRLAYGWCVRSIGDITIHSTG